MKKLCLIAVEEAWPMISNRVPETSREINKVMINKLQD